jgi:hypothetical protein
MIDGTLYTFLHSSFTLTRSFTLPSPTLNLLSYSSLCLFLLSSLDPLHSLAVSSVLPFAVFPIRFIDITAFSLYCSPLLYRILSAVLNYTVHLL